MNAYDKLNRKIDSLAARVSPTANDENINDEVYKRIYAAGYMHAVKDMCEVFSEMLVELKAGVKKGG